MKEERLGYVGHGHVIQGFVEKLALGTASARLQED